MQYCEQLIALHGFEPANAVSNLAIVAGVVLGLRGSARTRPTHAALRRVLMSLGVAIGVGSFLWHATHAAWAELADVLPILVFVLVFLFAAIRLLMGLSTGSAFAACVTMCAAIVGIGALAPRALNGSAAYLPVLLALVLLGVLVRIPAAAARLRAAAAVFALGLTARSLDLALCAHLPLGTHWGWHLGNGIVLYLALRALFGAPNPRTAVSG